MSTFALETVTTVPIAPLDHPAFIEEALQTPPRATRSAERLPLWVKVCLLFGGLFLVGAGSFFITVGVLREATW